MDLSVDTMHLKDLMVFFGLEGNSLSLFLLSPRINMLCHCSSTMTKDRVWKELYGTQWPLCDDVPLSTYSFIHSAFVFVLFVLYFAL